MAAEESKPTTSKIGLYGLAVMGQNFALNIAEHGFKISVCNRSPEKVDDTVKRAAEEGLGDSLVGYKDPKEFIASLEKPRAVVLLVKAGKPVEAVIDLLSAEMEAGDIIIDGGNEWFENSIRRSAAMEEKGIHFVGMGISGGEEGARQGPSLMPGGPPEAYERLKPIWEKVSAQVDDGPCVCNIGPIGSGNYVKMLHNGIEYGDMQLICETYDVLRQCAAMTNEEMAAQFATWNEGELNSYLIEITSKILLRRDDRNKEKFLIDQILDKAGNKGTGKWTVQEGAERGIPMPTIAAALDARFASALKEERIEASKILKGPLDIPAVEASQIIEDAGHALYAAKICSYAQGMKVLKQMSEEKSWGLNFGEIGRIWKGGCIIKAKFLNNIREAYAANPGLPNMLLDSFFAEQMNNKHLALRRIVTLAISWGIPCPALSASLSYYDSMRTERLTANLIQAQRDFFGAHTYVRLDDPSLNVHTEWMQTS